MKKRREIVTGPKTTARALQLVGARGVVRSRDLEATGISRTQIRRLVDRGLLQRVGRGLYRSSRAPLKETGDLAGVAQVAPAGVVCLLSALRFHRLTTQNPFEVWLAIDRKAWRPRTTHPPLRLVYMSGGAFRQGVEEHDVDGTRLRVFNAAKTVADCFKFRNKIGTDVAVEALREYRRVHPKRLEDIWRFAEIDRVTRVMRPYLEAVG